MEQKKYKFKIEEEVAKNLAEKFGERSAKQIFLVCEPDGTFSEQEIIIL